VGAGEGVPCSTIGWISRQAHQEQQAELMLFQREEQAKVAELKHTTLAIARLRFLFLAAKIWRHAGRVGVSYSDHYAERGLFQRLMERLRSIAPGETNFRPVLATALRS